MHHSSPQRQCISHAWQPPKHVCPFPPHLTSTPPQDTSGVPGLPWSAEHKSVQETEGLGGGWKKQNGPKMLPLRPRSRSGGARRHCAARLTNVLQMIGGMKGSHHDPTFSPGPLFILVVHMFRRALVRGHMQGSSMSGISVGGVQAVS